MHLLLELPSKVFAQGDLMRGHEEKYAVLGLGLGGEALRQTQRLAEQITPLGYRFPEDL